MALSATHNHSSATASQECLDVLVTNARSGGGVYTSYRPLGTKAAFVRHSTSTMIIYYPVWRYNINTTISIIAFQLANAIK